MKIKYTSKKTIRTIAFLVVGIINFGISAMYHEPIIQINPLTKIPDYQVTIGSKSTTGNTVDHVQLQLHDKTTNRQFVKQYEGKELEQLVAEAKKTYPEQPLDNAISLRLQDSLYSADLGNPKPLIALLDPNRHDRLEYELGITDVKAQLERDNQKQAILIGQAPEQIHEETAELIANLKHKEEYNLARSQFEQNAIANNRKALTNLYALVGSIRNLRSNDATYHELSQGIKRAGQAVQAVYQDPTIKNLFDLYNSKLFESNNNNKAKTRVEAQWTCYKLEVIHEFIKSKNGIIEHYTPYDNVKEILAYDIVSFIKSCDPENFPEFCLKVYQIPGFKGVFDHYKKASQGNWFTNSLYSLQTLPKNAFNIIVKNTISPSPEFPTYEHFKHLGTIDTLCREGKLEQARKLASPNVPIEQELIAEHSRLANVVTPQQQATPTTPKQEVTTPEQMPLIDSMSIAIAQESLNSNFPVNPYTVSVMRDYYGQDVKKITDFAPTNFKQLMVHDHITTTINKLSHRVFNASNVTEQALALYGIDAYIKAYELNKNEKLNLISDFLQQFEKEVDNAYLEMGTTFLKRLSHNAQHPVKYIREQVTGVLQLAYFITDASLGQFFRTTEQNNQFANNISKFINEFDRPLLEASQKEILAAVGALMADMAFDAGIACLAKLGAKVATAQLPKITAKAIETIERVNEVTQGKKQEIAITPEGIPLVLKSEAEHVAKQTSKEAIKDVALTGNITSKMTPEIAEHIKATLSKNKHLLDELDKKINELSKNVNMQKVGELIHDPKYLKLEEVAAEFYEKMRSISSDVTAIAHNTGISEEIINQIKNHVFLEDHILRDGTTRFFPMPDMAAAWQRLIDNKFVRSDLLLLQHEYAESFIMNGVEIGYEHAHSIVNQLYNWKNSL